METIKKRAIFLIQDKITYWEDRKKHLLSTFGLQFDRSDEFVNQIVKDFRFVNDQINKYSKVLAELRSSL